MLSPLILQQRSDLLQAVRNFFLSRSYVEVDTPIRQPVLIPEAEIIPVPSGDWFLQTSPELCMKRLLAGGCRKIFQICHCFRQGEKGRLHSEEFTMLEWYHAGWSYIELMQECEELVVAVTSTLALAGSIQQQDEPGILLRSGGFISLAPPWQRLRVEEAFQQFCGVAAKNAVEQDVFDQLLVDKIEPYLGRYKPTFLYDYPVPLASLAKQKPTDPEVAERFELYIDGIELANGFSELTDVQVQRWRFCKELAKIEGTRRAQRMPEKFLEALSGMPECAGIAFGLDRLLLVLAGREKLNEIVSFDEYDL